MSDARRAPVADAPLTIRPATVDDVATILRFIRELAAYEKLFYEVVADEQSLAQTLFSERPDAEVVIAMWGEEPVGFALYFFTYSTFLARRGLYLEDLYVTPSHRGRGIGTALLRRLARLALDRDCGRFEWSVLDWNESAIAFYRKLGAVGMNEWTVQRVTGDGLIRLASPD